MIPGDGYGGICPSCGSMSATHEAIRDGGRIVGTTYWCASCGQPMGARYIPGYIEEIEAREEAKRREEWGEHWAVEEAIIGVLRPDVIRWHEEHDLDRFPGGVIPIDHIHYRYVKSFRTFTEAVDYARAYGPMTRVTEHSEYAPRDYHRCHDWEYEDLMEKVYGHEKVRA